jgi:hypothetical protein
MDGIVKIHMPEPDEFKETFTDRTTSCETYMGVHI